MSSAEEQWDDGPRLTVAGVARRLGVAPATLRTWDRRYGVGPTEHTLGNHRRYTAADLGRLEVMRGLVLEGVPAREAARVALAGQHVPDARPDFPSLSGRLQDPVAEVPAELPGAAEVVRGLLRAAWALDSEVVSSVARQQLAAHGVLGAWNSVLLPLLIQIGARWASTGEGVEVEHLVSDCVSGALRQYALRNEVTAPPRPVLLACAPGDLHVLPLHALAAGLAERGTATRLLGADVPAAALTAAVRRTGAAALFVWAQTPKSGDPGPLLQLPVTRPATALVLGGQGWDPTTLPEHATLASDLGAAVALVGQALHAEQ